MQANHQADAKGETVQALGGALVEPEKITPASKPPADFDAFWTAKLAELAVVPMNAVVTPAESGRDDVGYALVSMDNIRGTHIEAQLARPKQGEKLPALLILQWAGVYGLQMNWVLDRAPKAGSPST